MAMVSASSAADSQLTRYRERRHRHDRKENADRQRLRRRHRAARNGPHRGARHFGVDVGVPPHVERPARARSPGHRRERGDKLHPIDRPRREREADCAREHDERHHARLEKNEMVDDSAPPTRRRRAAVVASARNCRQPNRQMLHLKCAPSRDALTEAREVIARRRGGCQWLRSVAPSRSEPAHVERRDDARYKCNDDRPQKSSFCAARYCLSLNSGFRP